MNKTVVIIAVGILSIAPISVLMSDTLRWVWNQEGHDEAEHESDGWIESRKDVEPVRNETYEAECGACHLAYQPGLLPASAWRRIMGSLDDHYGDDASLDGALSAQIRDYLISNAAERSALSRSRAFAHRGPSAEALPRITDTDYFRREHYEIPGRLVKGNREVGSFSNCQACHRNATAGVYNEHQVVIPGVGRWDD
jgi:cytochrome c5